MSFFIGAVLKVYRDDINEINGLFYDAKASAKILLEQDAFFMK